MLFKNNLRKIVKYVLLKKNSPNYAIFCCVILKIVIGKDWEHSFTETDLKHRISK